MTKFVLNYRRGTPSAWSASTARRSCPRAATRGIRTCSARRTSTGQWMDDSIQDLIQDLPCLNQGGAGSRVFWRLGLAIHGKIFARGEWLKATQCEHVKWHIFALIEQLKKGWTTQNGYNNSKWVVVQHFQDWMLCFWRQMFTLRRGCGVISHRCAL